jgi:hypothetical protein
MWPPHQLPDLHEDLRRAGLALDPAALSRLTGHPLNAVIDLGGCTASFVSPRGLVLTNHHCCWSSLQFNSTEERNLLQDGFLARDLGEELSGAPGSRVQVTVDVREVTDEVLRGVEEIRDGAARYARIEEREKRLIAACEADPGHRCRVRSFHGGLQYHLVKQLEIRDVRLVYAPPRSIGIFGGDVDNWTWPRHSGDFAFLRAYVGPDGRAADPSPANVPFRPASYLRVAARGVEQGDYVMAAGYPGRTNRYRLSSEVADTFDWYYPTMKALYDEAIDLIESMSETYPEIELRYATTVSGLRNGSKNFQGMIDGYARSGMLERKRARERELQRWIESDPARRQRHLSALADLERLVARQAATREREAVLGRLERVALLDTARRLYRLAREREKPDASRSPGYQERDLLPLRERLQRLDKRFHPELDKAYFRLCLARYAALPPEQRRPALDAHLAPDDPAALGPRLDRLYAETHLGESEHRLELLDAPRAALEASEDPFLRLAVALYEDDLALEREKEALAGEFQLVRPRYMEALIAHLGERGHAVYPDANGSLRLSYGAVRGYSPRDGVSYEPFTRLEGIREKTTGVEPFRAPPEQLRLIEARDHGRWRLETLGSVPVDFLSTVDTTGGSSGSPTLDARGELVGLLFDGTYDGINADWDYDESLTRAIHVDMRYVLWVMEKVDRAWRVLEELGVRSSPAPEGG